MTTLLFLAALAAGGTNPAACAAKPFTLGKPVPARVAPAPPPVRVAVKAPPKPKPLAGCNKAAKKG